MVSEDKISTDWEYFDSTKLNTGDIVFVKYNNFNGTVIKSMCSCKWHHLGIVYRDKETNDVFILEGARYSSLKLSNFFKIKLEDWLRVNRKCDIGYMPLKGKKLDPDVLYDVFEELIFKGVLRGFSPSWNRFLFERKYYQLFDHQLSDLTCVEGAIYTLQKAGVFEKKLCPTSYFIQYVLRRQIKTINGYEYGKPIELIRIENKKFYSLVD